MDSESFWAWKTVRESFQWRGLISSALLGVREFLRPVMYWHVWHIFITDVRSSVREPYAKKHVRVKIYSGEHDFETVAAFLSRFEEISPEEIRSRLSSGEAVAVAFAGERGDGAVGYMWLAFAGGKELAFGIAWILRTGEALRYGSFVVPEWRGLGVHSSLNHAVNEYALHRGMTHTLASIGMLNRQSLNLAKHYSNPKIMTLFAVNFRVANWTIAKAIGAPFTSHFSWRHRGAENE